MTVSQEKGPEEPQMPRGRPVEKLLVVVMGVSGCGKSTLGAHIASALALPFIDADDLHPLENVEKMSRGEPLTDDDRAPWLERVRDAAAAAAAHISADRASSTVVACSALKRAYREVLRCGPLRAVFVHPHGARDVLLSRMSARKNHFMKEGMLDSQIKTLEDPTGEDDVVRVPVEAGMTEQVQISLKGLEDLGVIRRM
ncbi:P-loop containing nucleoside triphosphate hydrolase protein [Vararia minispora EC-137]|uniref:P-loop containing nucleoside triphosphate hydrolase protein n=1 Tax=Vararia minispora EC-137 TaxID=1314806 RepID=A0ACB8QQJ3_9AGAM|nr:P-loop containing nucleoside triphosphate hydrolase protein [Vararia minispora EC-137]